MPTIIFLDVDGVILPLGSMKGVEFRDMIREPYGYIEDAAKLVPFHIVAHLKTLTQETGAKFVLISSWRGLFSRKFLEAFLRAIDGWKRRTGRPFPKWTELLAILKALGYEKRALVSAESVG